MPFRYVLDEHLRGALWHAIQHQNAGGVDPIDTVRVGGPPDLPLGTTDPDLLLWAEREGRIIVTRDPNTMPGHLADHLQAGHHSPGVFLLRPRTALAQVLAYLVLAAYTSDPAAVRDRIEYIP
jgi:hypothetical protein